MKRYAGLKLAGVGMLAILGMRVNATEQPIEIHIEGPSTVKRGSDIVVTIELINHSQDILPFDEGANSNFAMDVRDQFGRVVSKTKYGAAVLDGKGDPAYILSLQIESRHKITVQPMAKITEKAYINRLFDTVNPGPYTVRVKRNMVELDGSVVRSNLISIDVTK